jgi:hypothetical protein
VINFRYHVVSLTAVFLALAIGLVVGTTALNGPISDSFKEQVDELRKQNQQLREDLNHLDEEVQQKEDFARQAAPALLGRKLAGSRVLLVTVPSGVDYANGVASMLTTSGATITGQIDIKDQFLDPARNEELLDLAHTSLPKTVTGTLPTNADGVEASTALLAAVLVDRLPAVPTDDLRKVLAAYQSEGYLGVTGDEITGPAQTVVFISGPPLADKDGPRKNAEVVTMVDQFDQAGRIVVASNSVAGGGNVVAAVRADPRLKVRVSTVDNVSTPQGELVTALAVVDQLAGVAGHYGIGDGATLLPATP